jgi:hypothetical protein
VTQDDSLLIRYLAGPPSADAELEAIRQRWIAKLRLRFPRQSEMPRVDKSDVIMLDSYVAGCVSTFINRDGKLDRRRIEILQECVRELAEYLPLLDGSVLEYFVIDQGLAEAVLAAVDRDPRRVVDSTNPT